MDANEIDETLELSDVITGFKTQLRGNLEERQNDGNSIEEK